MVSNKRKIWNEAQERGLIEDYVDYSDLTEKEIQAIIESSDEEETLRCTECGEIGTDRGEGNVFCDDCYEDIMSVTDPHRFYEDDDYDTKEESEEVLEEEPDEEPDEEPEEVPEEVLDEEPEEVPKKEPVVIPKSKPVPKKYIKITRNVAVDNIPIGTLVKFKCKPGSNIRNFAGDMSVGLVVAKRSGAKSYAGKLTRKLKKDIKLKKIILIR